MNKLLTDKINQLNEAGISDDDIAVTLTDVYKDKILNLHHRRVREVLDKIPDVKWGYEMIDERYLVRHNLGWTSSFEFCTVQINKVKDTNTYSVVVTDLNTKASYSFLAGQLKENVLARYVVLILIRLAQSSGDMQTLNRIASTINSCELLGKSDVTHLLLFGNLPK